MAIIKGLRLIRQIRWFFNITVYSVKDNNKFYIRLVDLETKKIIYSGYIGTMNTNGTMLELNLLKTQGLVCNEGHHVTDCHDSDKVFCFCFKNAFLIMLFLRLNRSSYTHIM